MTPQRVVHSLLPADAGRVEWAWARKASGWSAGVKGAAVLAAIGASAVPLLAVLALMDALG